MYLKTAHELYQLFEYDKVYDIFYIYKVLDIKIIELNIPSKLCCKIDNTILISIHNSKIQKRIMLAHELAHLLLGHKRQLNAHCTKEQEKEANLFALLLTFSYLTHIIKTKE